tara:strand:+ start:55 stop:486 length:432 start_codon:yes stop_codon:yes gene_type:complete
MSKLTNKQEMLFNAITSGLRKEVATQYIKNGYENGKQAYLAACKKLKRNPSKNPETSSCEILRYPNVVAFIESTQIAAAEEAQITADWVLNGIKTLTDRLIDSEDPKAAYKGLELGGKYLALFTEKVELEANVRVTEIARKII